ncbi:MAG: N(4)-(beta-N-acetylglucosaminyl)-L-asparaginase [Longimicrobiales bacterium]
MTSMSRRDFVRTSTAGFAVAGVGVSGVEAVLPEHLSAAPAVHTRKAVSPVVISDVSGIRYRNGGDESAVERAFRLITEGADVLDALIEGVNIPELDPEESGIGYGGLPNADGVVQLDASCMHGPKRWAGGVAALEGVRTPSRVAKAVMELTDHHLLVGEGAQEFARQVGFTIEDDLNTEHSRELWLEWRRRVDPGHWLDPETRERRGAREETDPDVIGRGGRQSLRERSDRFYQAGLDMVDEGLIPEESFWGTINCNGIGPTGDIGGVTTTSGLSWKIPGRVGDSPVLGAGLYVDGAVGAAGSTGRGEANLYNLASFLVVENMRDGLRPKDAGMAALRRIQENTVEERLLNGRGLPAFDVRFFVLNAVGEYAGVALYGASERNFAVCTENGAEELPLEGLLEGSPRD